MGTCPECEENFDLDEGTEPGDILACPKCTARLEIQNVFPITVDYAPESEE